MCRGLRVVLVVIAMAAFWTVDASERTSASAGIIVQLSDEVAASVRNRDTVPPELSAVLPADAKLVPLFQIPPARNLDLWYEHHLNRWFHIRALISNPEEFAAGIPLNTNILSVDLDKPVDVKIEPNDYSNFDMWDLDIMRCPQAWDIHHGNSNILLAILDSGCEITHPDLAANVHVNPGEDLNHNGLWDITDNNSVDDDSNGFVDDIVGWDFVNHTPDSSEQVEGEEYAPPDNLVYPDIHGHGTHVTGTAAAVTDNGIGVASASWNVKIMPLRVAYATWLNGEFVARLWYSDAAAATQYAADMGADITSNSYGGTGYNQAFQDVINYARSLGVLVVAAAGNESTSNPLYPAAFANVVAVAAITYDDIRAYFTNYGNWVDIAAPGVGIWSTMSNNVYHPVDYAPGSGTSMACPHVAAVAGLTLAYDPSLTVDAVESILIRSADNLDAVNPDYTGLLGSGRVNAEGALSFAAGDSLPAPEISGVSLDRETGIVTMDWTFDSEGRPDFQNFRVFRDDDSVAATVDSSFSDTLPDVGYYRYGIAAVFDAGPSVSRGAVAYWPAIAGLPFYDGFEGDLSGWSVSGVGTPVITGDPVYDGDGALSLISSGDATFVTRVTPPVPDLDVEAWFNIDDYAIGIGDNGGVFVNDGLTYRVIMVDSQGRLVSGYAPPYPPVFTILEPGLTISRHVWYKYKIDYYGGGLHEMLLDTAYNVISNRLVVTGDPDQFSSCGLASAVSDSATYYDNVHFREPDHTFEYFAPVAPTSIPYAIIVSSAQVDGQMYSGELAIMDGAVAVGAEHTDDEWPLETTAWQGVGPLPGYTFGNPISFAFVQNETVYEFDSVSFDVGDGTFGNGTFSRVHLFATVNAADEPSEVPGTYALYPNFPNPFNPQTTIRFDLARAGMVSLKVYNLLGQEVATVIDKRMSAGAHAVNLDAAHLASGVYVYRLHSGDFTRARKMVVLK
jgi:subtilisin family serine protease